MITVSKKNVKSAIDKALKNTKVNIRRLSILVGAPYHVIRNLSLGKNGALEVEPFVKILKLGGEDIEKFLTEVRDIYYSFEVTQKELAPSKRGRKPKSQTGDTAVKAERLVPQNKVVMEADSIEEMEEKLKDTLKQIKFSDDYDEEEYEDYDDDFDEEEEEEYRDSYETEDEEVIT
jgi:hypothetical protein